MKKFFLPAAKMTGFTCLWALATHFMNMCVAFNKNHMFSLDADLRLITYYSEPHSVGYLSAVNQHKNVQLRQFYR